MRRFNLYRRGKSGVFYCRFFDEASGKWLSGISTSETDERAAMATVALWERDGIPSREGRSVESVTGTKRIIDNLRTADLGSTDTRAIVDLLRERGLITAAIVAGSASAEPLVTFLHRFWDYEQSPYVREKIAHRQRITRKHCYTMDRHVRNWWAPHFGESILLGELTREKVREFSLALGEAEIADGTRLHIMNAGSTALRWAQSAGMIEIDPTHGVTRYAGAGKRRDVLSTDEVRKLFALEWPSPNARLASLVAMTCGLRAGEVAALMLEDIGDDRIHVRHSWSPTDKLKQPKNGETREVPLLPAIRDQLRELARRNPWGEAFVFWSSVTAGQPVEPNGFQRGLTDALCILSGATAEEIKAYHRIIQARSMKRKPKDKNLAAYRKDLAAHEKVGAIRAAWIDRGVVFHSWRHFYASRLADRIDLRLVQTATGHKSQAMAEHYANHASAEQFREVSDAARLAFGFVDASTG